MSETIKVKNSIFVIIPIIIVGLAILAVLIGFLWNTPPAPRPPQAVVFHTIQRDMVKTGFEVIGLLEAEQSVELRARVSGFLEKKTFKDGDRVKKGDLLFQIEPYQYEALLAAAEADELSARAQLDKIQLDFKRTQDLYAKRAVPKSDYDSAVASLDVARAALLAAEARKDQAALNLGYASIRAPFDGEVSDSPYSTGALLGPESLVLATVVANDVIEVSFGISDRIMSDFRLSPGVRVLPDATGANVDVFLKINGQQLYDQVGTISYVAPFIDRQTDTVRFKARFQNPGKVLAPGQSVIVRLEPKESRQVLLAPKAAVMTSDKGRFVYVPAQAKDGEGNPQEGLVAESRPVTVVAEHDNGFEISDGLVEGDRVIILGLMSGGALLRPGAPVVEFNPPEKSPAEGETAAGEVE